MLNRCAKTCGKKKDLIFLRFDLNMPSKKINKILVANRGEIAVRIMRTLKKLGISSVAVCADDDRMSLHCRMADEVRSLGNGTVKDTYLDIQKIIDVALDTGVDAIHPGYGFLSENPDFVEACVANNIIFIGPDADVMRLMGNKKEARRIAVENGIPVVFGMTGIIEEIAAAATDMPYPVLIKAAAGGGGKGMHIVENEDELLPSLLQASREAENYFANGEVYVEKYLENPRHIEVQILADKFGNVIHLFERECSVQRRYQKIIEESPSPSLSEQCRHELCDTAVRLCKSIGYTNAGTVEFLVDNDMNFYFLEMNTRIQVEHPVTEQRTGIDIVEEQIRIARGKVMGYTQESVTAKGHAMECRIYAEDPQNGFLPAPSKLTLYHEPRQRGVRIDSGIDGQCVISECYDPMISKLICHGKTRADAIEIMRDALGNYIVHTDKSNIPYLQCVIEEKDFIDNRIDTSYCKKHHDVLMNAMQNKRDAVRKHDVAALFLFHNLNIYFLENKEIDNVWKEIGYWRFRMNLIVEVDGYRFNVEIKKLNRNMLKCSVDDVCCEVYLAAADKVLVNGRTESLFVSETPSHDYCVHFKGLDFICRRDDQLNESIDYSHQDKLPDNMCFYSPMPGKVMRINVKEGDTVTNGTVLCVVEAMKMENNIVAATDAKVNRIYVCEGDKVDAKTLLIDLI